jgi:GTP-binding protein
MDEIIRFANTEFLLSAPTRDHLPQDGLPQVALLGRSNVGKSSFINALTSRKQLAVSSSQPGRTRLMNVFCVDTRLLMIDLPGYGFIKGGKEKRRRLTDLLNQYLTGGLFSLVVWFLDHRHPPSDDDLRVNEWLFQREIPFIPILTKTDKLKRGERYKMGRTIADDLGIDEDRLLRFSIQDHSMIEIVRSRVRELFEKNLLGSI